MTGFSKSRRPMAFVIATLLVATPLAALESDPQVEGLRTHLANGRYTDAENEARSLLAVAEERSSVETLLTADVLDVLTEALWRQREYYDPEALGLAERAVALREDLQGSDAPELVSSLTNLANLLLQSGERDAAIPHYERALELADSTLGPDHPSVAAVLDGLGAAMKDAGEKAEAKRLYDRALEIKRSALGPEHAEIAYTLNLLGWWHYHGGDAATATAVFEQALAIAEQAFESDHPFVAESLKNHGVMLAMTGKLDDGRVLLERARRILHETYGEMHPLYAATLANLAIVGVHEGAFEEAEQLSHRALNIQERLVGPRHVSLRPLLDVVGWAAYNTGDYTAARDARERMRDISEMHYGADHPAVAGSYWILGVILWRLGDEAEAEAAFERAIELMEGQSTPNEFAMANFLTNYGFFLFSTGRSREALPISERAVRLVEKVWGSESPWALESRVVYGQALLETGDVGRARRILEETLERRRTLLGPEHPDVAHSLESLAEVCRRTGKPTEARHLLEQALDIWEKTIGPSEFHTGDCLSELSRVLAEEGACERAYRAGLRAEGIGRDSLRLFSRGLSERQTLRYAATRPSGLSLSLSIAEDDGVERFQDAEALWDAVVRSRGIVLDEMASRRRDMRASADPEVAHMVDELSAATTRLANLTVRGPEGIPVEQYNSLIGSARQRKESAEARLAARSAAVRQTRASRKIGFQAVSDALPTDWALIAFVKYENQAVNCSPGALTGGAPELPESHGEPASPVPSYLPAERRTTPSYLALVRPAGEAAAVVVPLGPANEIDGLVSNWREAVSTPPEALRAAARAAEERYRTAGGKLRRAVWDPAVRLAGSAGKVLVVPDGALNLVSFATLPAEDGRYLLETGPVFHYLSTERDVVTGESSGAALGRGLLAIGGSDFEASPDLPSDEAIRLALARPSTAGAGEGGAPVYRGPHSGCASFGSLRFKPLPGTRREVDEIARLWEEDSRRRRTGSPIMKLTSVLAHEKLFKQHAPGKRVLHLATHGFFLDGPCGSGLEDSQTIEPASSTGKRPPKEVLTESPLLHSGLALAGADNRSKAKPNQEDGVLTAEEIASLDLTGTEWAVLSACQSGVGQVMSGEGVLGLRRAFEIAGTRTLIMSLWVVQDESARRWMRDLYAGRFDGLSTADAVRRASLRMLEARRGSGQSTHPFFWGAFVAAGDWR